MTGPALSAYKPRHIRFVKLWRPKDWTLKVYMISAHGNKLPEEFENSALKFIEGKLPEGVDNHRAGFVIIHHGVIGNWVMLDWWSTVLLFQRVYKENSEGGFVEAPADLVQCIWELNVTAFERQAWVDSVLANPRGPDVDEYFDAHFDGLI